jgi:hypothetical protein
MKKILFITTSDLVTNPRLVKELELANENNFEISVFYCSINGWSKPLTDEFILSNKHITFYEVSATRKPFFPWFISSVLEFLLKRIPKTLLSTKLLAYSLNKRSVLLKRKLSKLKGEFDWVIAHNPGAFYPAFNFSKKHGSKLGIDVEDYHPGESSNDDLNCRMKTLMKRILPEAEYCSFAAPLIENEVQNHITNRIKKSIVVLNGFNEFEFSYKESDWQKLKLVWYSQNIDFGRGLEGFLEAFNELQLECELTLIGNLKPDFAAKFDILSNTKIKLISPVSQKELHLLLSNYDVGLALDFPINRNREIALTNKIVSYVQAGLFIFSSITPAQELFILENCLEAHLVKNELQDIKLGLEKLIKERNLNGFNKLDQFEKGKLISWQHISKPLIEEWLIRK